ncbi:MAG TPA: diphthine synthase [Methanoregulaceae archaeon]|nr:diphthine synthase [Methanoregulaceae archaeon]
MLSFVGLGLFDLYDISIKGLECIRKADHIFLETYTSRIMGSSREDMEEYYQKPITLVGREDVEQHPDAFLDLAKDTDVVFLTGGDPMVSTTHMDLRIRACRKGIPTAIIHGSSISSAVCGLSGLQNYRFGKSCSVPFPHKNWFPMTPIEVIAQNLSLDLHTLVFLDIQKDRYMTIREAIELLEVMAGRKGISIPLYVGVARAGSEKPVVAAGTAGTLKNTDFGSPLHILIIPAELHVMEREYLELFAGL